MKIKSLLLGSAAVLVGVIGANGAANAADAIVVEPEPVEYVRICDAYGKGWFYIPGTETCLKFDGDVRVQYGFAEIHDTEGLPILNTADTVVSYDETSLHEFNYRARLNVRANNETEYGTLSSRIRFSAEATAGVNVGVGGGHNDLTSIGEGPGSAGTLVDIAIISLAGFRIGFDDDYWSTAGGYGYYEARFDGPYGFGNGLFFDYTWTGNGFAATIGLQDGNASGEAGAPDFYAGVTYSGSGWYFAGIYYNDSSADAGAWKVRADYDFGSNGFAVGGWYMSDDGETDYVKGHAWGVTAKMNLSDTMILFGGYGSHADQYWNNPTAQLQGTPDALDSSFDTYTVGIAWNIVPGLLIQPEWTGLAFDVENGENLGDVCNAATPCQLNGGRFSLRIVRSF